MRGDLHSDMDFLGEMTKEVPGPHHNNSSLRGSIPYLSPVQAWLSNEDRDCLKKQATKIPKHQQEWELLLKKGKRK